MKEFYEEPDELLKRRKFIEYKTRLIDSLFPKDKTAKIADLGCGYGLLLDACRKAGYDNSEGVEQIDACIEYANKELGLKNISKSDLFDFLESKSGDTFDVITALNVVEHVKKEKTEYLLNLIYKKLHSGGIFIMEVPNADSPLGISIYFSDLTHEFAFSRKLAVKLLRLAEFEDVKVMYQPNIRNPLIKLAQKIIAKIVGFEHKMMFSGNIILVGYKK